MVQSVLPLPLGGRPRSFPVRAPGDISPATTLSIGRSTGSSRQRKPRGSEEPNRTCRHPLIDGEAQWRPCLSREGNLGPSPPEAQDFPRNVTRTVGRLTQSPIQPNRDTDG